MATERITIQVESNIGEDGPLTVTDTLHQFMDAFELIAAAVAQESGGEKVKWRLERLSKNSPATAVAVAYCPDPNVVLGPLVYNGKQRLSSAIEELGSGNVVPWLGDKSHLAKSLLRRNLNGIGRTIFDFDGDATRTVLVEKNSRSALKSIELFEAKKDQEDRSRSEFGSIDAHVAEVRSYYGKSAIYVTDRLSGRTVPCVLNANLADRVGKAHNWLDTWTGKRVRVKGQLFFNKSGQIKKISAIGLEDVAIKQIELRKLQGLNILQGKSPIEHLDSIWGGSND